jgi:hypothetical protein
MRQALTIYSLLLWLSWVSLQAQNMVPTQQGGKWGLADSTGKVLIPFEQDRVRYLADGVYAYWQGPKVKLYGNRLKKKEYRDAAVLKGTGQTLVLANEKGLYGLVKTSGKKLLDFRFCAPPKALEDNILLPVRDGKQINFGLYTLDGENIIPPTYYSIQTWGKEYYKAQTQTGGEVLLDLEGKVIFQSEEKTINWVTGNFIVVGTDEDREIFVKNGTQPFALKNMESRGGMMMGYNEEDVFCILTPAGKLIKLKANQEVRSILNGYILICELDKNRQCDKERLLDADMKPLLSGKFDHIPSWEGDFVVVQPDRSQEIYNLYRLNPEPELVLKNKQRIELYDHGWLRVYDGENGVFWTEICNPKSFPIKKRRNYPKSTLRFPCSTFAVRENEIRDILTLNFMRK